MTYAVCYKCGKMKFGAFNTCQHCGEKPSTEDDIALSFSMTDHYFDIPTLEKMGHDVSIGKSPQLNAESKKNMVQMMRSSKELMDKVFAHDSKKKGSMKSQIKWWQFWKQ